MVRAIRGRIGFTESTPTPVLPRKKRCWCSASYKATLPGELIELTAAIRASESERDGDPMHLYNAWLPPPVAAETIRESESFAAVVSSVRGSWRSDDPDSAYGTLKWISVIDLFLKAKSEVSLADVEVLVMIGLEIFLPAQDKLYAQVRWGNIIVKLLKKHGKKLKMEVQWRPLYDTLIRSHFKRNTGPEGWKLRQRHFETVTSLIRSCKHFFPTNAASVIWSEFRDLLNNPWHNSSFEGAGFLRLFLPMNLENQEFFTSEWIRECLNLWDRVPNCQFWDVQWTSIIMRCIKNCKLIDWEPFLPVLYTHYINMFEIPLSNSNGSYPYPLEVHRNTRFLFSSKTGTPAKAIAKSIVHLWRPGNLAMEYFEKFVNLIEQFYHPSNGGRWTYSLERFLRHLVIAFQKRLLSEQLSINKQVEPFGKLERERFIKSILKLIDRGQYSKCESLAETVAVATSILAYMEPTLVLPFVASRFYLASETMTATHQLKTAVMSVAFSGRAFLLSLLSNPQNENNERASAFMDLIAMSFSNALLGMDANDPPKTLATMQLIGSIFSNLFEVGDDEDGPIFLQSISFSEWLDEFFCRLFSLFLHLEPSNSMSEGVLNSITSGTFLVEDSPYYFCMLEVLLGKLSNSLFSQSLKKISKFVNGNILPGATIEVGLLCCACIHSNPEEASIQLIKPILASIISSLNGDSNVIGRSNASPMKETLSPALETSIEYQIKILAIGISYAGLVLVRFKDELKEAIALAFQTSSWKVNGAGDHLLRSLLGSLALYYPMEQYRPSPFRTASIIEDWECSKDRMNEKLKNFPKWHIPTIDELLFANELLDLHFRSALVDIISITEMKMHTEGDTEKERLKVMLLRVYSSLQGVMSCLPDLRPSFKNDGNKVLDESYFLISGAIGSSVGNTEMREKAAQDMHIACKYMMRQHADDSIILLLVIRIMDALGNFGGLEYDEWSNHIQAWKLESAAIIEPPCNFIVESHTPGKKRPRWALIDKSYMHNTWRSSQSSFHKYRTDASLAPSENLVLLMEDILSLSLHRYETVRSLAARSLLKMLKRWRSCITKCVLSLTENLSDPKTPEHVVLGSCSILATQTVLRHLTTDALCFSSFITGLLASSHHETLKAQKAIIELFVKFNIHFSGISKSFFRSSDSSVNGSQLADLISHLSSMSFDSSSLHWRYNLMANRVLLLLTLASKDDSYFYSKNLAEIAGHFLRNLRSQLPQSRMLAISALNTLLEGTPHKNLAKEGHDLSDHQKDNSSAITAGLLGQILEEDRFFDETFESLSHMHMTTDSEVVASKGSQGASSLQSLTDKAITFFYFDFSASWPRTPNWISLLGNDIFFSSFARIFKRLSQECGAPVLHALRSTLNDFSNVKERSKQCVAAEALAGILHSDINGLSEAWEQWIMLYVQKVIMSPSVESLPEWAASIRYAVTGKGKCGSRTPCLRQPILDCLAIQPPMIVATNVLAKRYALISAALIEISPSTMTNSEAQYHFIILEELLNNMSHPSSQVREVVGVTLSVICSNLRSYASFKCTQSQVEDSGILVEELEDKKWAHALIEGASEIALSIQNANPSENLESDVDTLHENGFADFGIQHNVRRMETMCHFIISALKSGRSSFLLDIIVGLLYPVISLQETSYKDLSTLAKSAFELLKWRTLPRHFLENAVMVMVSSVDDSNWHCRVVALAYLRNFMYRHTFALSDPDKIKIWRSIEKLLVDNQVEVREKAAGVLASLMKGGDEKLSTEFRNRAYALAHSILRKPNQRNVTSVHSIASVHGSVLALVASVLSVPYDMPSWLPEHVTLLAGFINETSPVKSTVTKAIAEFRRTHADTWSIHKESFTEDQLEILADMSSSSSYFA